MLIGLYLGSAWIVAVSLFLYRYLEHAKDRVEERASEHTNDGDTELGR